MKENNQFMQDFHAVYLSQNRPGLSESYRIAKQAAANRGDAWIPSLSTVKRAVKRLPKDVVTRARGIV